MKLYESKNKINEGGCNIDKRIKDMGYNYLSVLKYISSCDTEKLGIIKKTSSTFGPYEEIPKKYTKKELVDKFLDFIINTPFDLSKMGYAETINAFKVKTFGTDVLVELFIDIKLGLINKEQFDLVYNSLIQEYNSLSDNMKKEELVIIDTELKNKKRFKRIIFTDDFCGYEERYFKFPNGIREVIDILLNNEFMLENNMNAEEVSKLYCLESFQKVKKIN